MSRRLLIISNDPALAPELTHHYERQGWQVDLTASVERALTELHDGGLDPHVAVCDWETPASDLLDRIESTQQSDGPEWVIVYGAAPEHLESRIEAVSYGALPRPFKVPKLDQMIERAYRSVRVRRELAAQRHGENRRSGVDAYIGHSPASRSVKEMLGKLTEIPVSAMIITGETGTGKGLIARILHHSGMRRDGPLIETNCAALPKELLESELFGHEPGAFTGAKSRHRGLMEQADGGTLFLDEIADLDMDLQAKLLKAIEDQKIRRLGAEREISIDIQIIAASSIDLEAAALSGDFREDFYHRLSVFSLHLPPLRDRKEDLKELVPSIIDEFNAAANRRVQHIPDGVWDRFYAYDWPGNVRELRNVIERCVLLAGDETLPERWLQLNHAQRDDDNHGVEVRDGQLSIPLDGNLSLKQIDRLIIEQTLQHCDYNVAAAARTLGTTRETLRYRMRKYNLGKH